MFEVKKYTPNMYYVCDPDNYLHSDGHRSICPEYWPTRELAQAVLDKYQFKPKVKVEFTVSAETYAEAAMVAQTAFNKAIQQKAIKLEHVWEHGDVFRTRVGSPMIYLVNYKHGKHTQAFCLSPPILGPADCQMDELLTRSTFLFNIKDALDDRGIL